MSHIIHTCLIALRLISSVGGTQAEKKSFKLFDNELMNSVMQFVYVDPGVFDRKNAYSNSQNTVNYASVA